MSKRRKAQRRRSRDRDRRKQVLEARALENQQWVLEEFSESGLEKPDPDALAFYNTLIREGHTRSEIMDALSRVRDAPLAELFVAVRRELSAEEMRGDW